VNASGGGTALRALVIGGGVGGLTAAVALRRLGVDAIVCEREADLAKAQVGGCFSLYANAMRPLQELGLGPQFVEVGSVLKLSEARTMHGRTLGVNSLEGLQRRFEAPSAGVSRTDAHRTLSAALPEGVVRMGAACTGFEQDQTGVTARFADGSTERGDLLVGADGLNSTIRVQQFGAAEPRYAGYTVWQGIAPTPSASFGSDTVTLCYGRGLRFVVYPVRDAQPYWAALLTTPKGGRDPAGKSKEVVLDLFRDWFPGVCELIDQTPDSAISRMDNFGRDPLERWGDGRVTLLGDAAHPTTINIGQGACQAVEDAFALGECLRSEPDVEQALRRYEQCRGKRTRAIMKFAWQVGATGQWANPVAVRVREYVLKLGWKRVIGPSFDRRIGDVDLFCGSTPSPGLSD
jgi:2-polyprenyl-6-methoxyphenol hydroxylase-like FAD-dependent oxidoreductase